MQRDEPTLLESLDRSLLRAGFEHDEASAALITHHLNDQRPRARILALRGAARRGLLASEQWRHALSDHDRDVRRETLELVARSVVDDSVLDIVLAHLRDADPLVVDAAAFALGEHLFQSAVDELVRVATHHEDARCRESAIGALGALGNEGGRHAVLGALDDKPSVRRRAIVALANFEGPDIEAALERAREDRDWQVRAAVDQLERED